jgi:hypothetical protein
VVKTGIVLNTAVRGYRSLGFVIVGRLGGERMKACLFRFGYRLHYEPLRSVEEKRQMLKLAYDLKRYVRRVFS